MNSRLWAVGLKTRLRGCTARALSGVRAGGHRGGAPPRRGFNRQPPPTPIPPFVSNILFVFNLWDEQKWMSATTGDIGVAQSMAHFRSEARDDVRELTRCGWARNELAVRYHDEEWGVPLHDDRA